MATETRQPSFTGDAPAAAEPAALVDRRELALVAVERTRMPMVVTDAREPDNPIVLANDAFLKLTGYSAGEVIGRNCRFLQGPETDPADVNVIRLGLTTSREDIAVEILNYRKDGSAFWNQLAISPVCDDGGEVIYYFASQKDVTARRRTEELERTERLLLREVDHRAMNALALVQSIISLSDSDGAPGYAASIRGRVDALARAHRILAHSGWRGVALDHLVAAETASTTEARVIAHGPSAEVPPELAQSMTLVLHELMSNALRHGALARPVGTVDVTWTKEPERIFLEWQESGVKEIMPPTRAGFGLRLLRGIIERQLGGSVDLSWSQPGFGAKLAVPIDKSALQRHEA